MSGWKFWKHEPKQAHLPGYSEFFAQAWPKNTPIEDIRFAVLDTETTGLNAQKDRILSIAAVAVQHGSICITDRFEAYIQQADSTPNASVAIHEITPTDSEGKGEPENLALHNFALWLRNAVVVGHHVQFDFDILSHALYHHHGLKLSNKTLDTALLAIRLMEPAHERAHINPSQYSLKSLAHTLQIESMSRHTAAGDALTTALVLIHLLHLAKKRGIRTVRDLVGG